MTANPLDDVRMRVLGVAVDLGWTPPGWRSAPYPPETRLGDRVADWAIALVWGAGADTAPGGSATFRLCEQPFERRSLRPSTDS